MKKRVLFILVFILSLPFLGAKSPVYPSDVTLGQCVPSDSTEQHKILSKALSEPYGFDWAETYLHPEFKKNLALLYSPLLSDLLPIESALYSRSSISSEGTYVISVKNMKTGDVLSFAVSDGFISAILN